MEAIERYLNDGVDINAADANGLTPLAWAAVNDTPFEIAKFLIDKGANVNARDHIESTPLHDAAGAGHREIVALLISKGADLNARNKDGKTPEMVLNDVNDGIEGKKKCREIFKRTQNKCCSFNNTHLFFKVKEPPKKFLSHHLRL